MRRLFLKLFRRRRLHQDLEAEIAFHREMAAAHDNAIPFGNPGAIKEQALDLWRFTAVENFWRDLVYAARGLRRSPSLVFSALLSLGLGIGANTAIFSLAVEFLFSEPSVTGANSLVSIRVGGSSHRKKEVLDFIRASGVFEDVAGENEETFINWNDGSETRRIFSVHTTKNYFSALGVPMAYGRGILPNDPNDVVVLRHQFWRRHFNGDSSIVGRAINLDGRPYTVVGILPAAHRTLLGFGFSPDVYVPQYLPDTVLAIYARLKPGMNIEGARAALLTVARQMDVSMPEQWKYAGNCTVSPIAGMARLEGENTMAVGLFFLMLQIVAGLVLLIACVNVASLLLARASARRREIAIRLSLGAGRTRLLQQLLVESLLVSGLGAAAGLAASHLTAILLARVSLPLPIPIRLQIEPDWRVGIFAAVLTVIAALACGLLPAWHALKESISPALHQHGKLRVRRSLVVAQIALSLIVLTTGVLFLRNLMKASSISPGFDVRQTLRAEIHLPPVAYKSTPRKNAYIAEVLRALESLPGVDAAAAARIIPFTDSTRFGVDVTFPDTGEALHLGFHWNAVTRDYFRAMGIPLLRGRTFSPADSGAAAKPVIVNRAFVTRYLGSREPIGRVFLWGADGKTPYVIAGGTKNLSIGEDDAPQLYESLSLIANDRPRVQFVVRSAIPPITQLAAVRRALRAVEPNAGIEVETLYSSIGLAFLPSQVGAALLGGIGVLGLLLAAVGLYGVMVYSVTRRTREIGVRIAVGARPADISRMILRDTARLLGWGCGIGLLVSYFITKPLAMFLVPGLTPGDPVSFAAVVVVFAATGAVAAFGPVRRALGIDPITCLRHE